MADVEAIDRHLAFLRSEIVQLSKRSEPWAQRKIDALQSIADTLRSVRQDQQMTGIEGRRLEW